MLGVSINSGKKQEAELIIINYAGAIVKTQSVYLSSSTNHVQIPVSDLPAGIYFLKINGADGTTLLQRFNKMK